MGSALEQGEAFAGGDQVEDLKNRLRKVARHWDRWARRRGVSVYRIYDRDIPTHPLIVDRYEDRVLLQVFARGDEGETADDASLRALASEVLEVEPGHVHLKTRARQRGASQYGRLARKGEEFAVSEGGNRFLVNLEEYLDTGLFIDHRNTRAWVQERASGVRFLNLFAYTGTFTVCAARGGAASTVSVDTSRSYLEWAKRNLTINQIDLASHGMIRQDVRDYLDDAARMGDRFDLILLDPPTFSNSKTTRDDLEVQRDHVELVRAALGVLASDGVLFFSTSRRRFRLDAASLSDLGIREVTHKTVPEDFGRHRPHRCWEIRRVPMEDGKGKGQSV